MLIRILAVLATVKSWLVNQATGPNPKPVTPPWLKGKGGKGRFVMALREQLHFGNKGPCFANVGETVSPHGRITRLADSGAAGIARFLICKTGSDANHVTINAASTTIPLGVLMDEANAAEDALNIQLFGVSTDTLRVIANGAISVDGLVYTAANGKVQPTPSASSGVAYKVGRALTSASNDGDIIEIEPCFPLSVTF